MTGSSYRPWARRVVSAAPSALLGSFLAIASPVTAFAQRSEVYSPAELRALGQQSLARTLARHGRVDEPDVRRDLEAVITRIARVAAYRQHPITWELVGDSSLNASALPGGVMIINIGLPLFCREYGSGQAPGDQEAARRKYVGCLAAVIGHEMAHMTLGHTESVGLTIRRREEIERRSGRTTTVASALRDTVLMAGLRYERAQELEADRAGALYTLRAGWAVQDAIDLFVAMDSVARLGTAWRGQLTWLRGHPRLAERAALLEARRAQLKLNQRDFDDALSLIDHDVMPDSALSLLNRVLRDFPDLPAARHAKAVVLTRRWLADASVRTLRVRPSMPAYDARFLTAIRGGADPAAALRAARAAFEQALAVGAHPYTLANVAVLDAYAGDPAKALQRAELAAQRLPSDPDVQNNLGVVHFLAGRLRESLRAFARAEELAGDNLTPAIAFNVARASAAVGDTSNAIRLLARYVAYDSRSGWGREASRLYQELGGAPIAAHRPSPSGGDPTQLPVVAGVRLGARATQVLRTLGPPDQEEENRGGVVWRYASRGIVLLVEPQEGVRVIQVETREAGEIAGVRVGDNAADALRVLGPAAERERKSATRELVAFDRGSWAVIVAIEGTEVQAVSAAMRSYLAGR